MLLYLKPPKEVVQLLAARPPGPPVAYSTLCDDGRAGAHRLRTDENIVLKSTKYCIGVLTRIPVSIGNILEYWFLTDPTKYWNILEKLFPGAGLSPRNDLEMTLFKTGGRLGTIWKGWAQF